MKKALVALLVVAALVAQSSIGGGAQLVTQGGTGTATQFTQGSVIFAGASGIYTQDNSSFFWDATNHRLGIGITSPLFPLQVKVATNQDLVVLPSTSPAGGILVSAVNDAAGANTPMQLAGSQVSLQTSSDMIANGAFSSYAGATPGTVSVLPYLFGRTSQKAQTASADTNVLTVAPAAAAGTYEVCVAISVSSATNGVIAWTYSYTDSNGAAQSNIAAPLFQAGTAAPNTTFTTSAAGNYHGCAKIDVNNAAANIVIKWVGGGTTAALMSAWVQRII